MTPTHEIPKVYQRLQSGVLKARNSTLTERLELLKKFEQGLLKHQENFVQALAADFQKPRFESLMSELFPIKEEIKIIRSELADWMQPQRVSGSPFFPGSKSYIRHEGKGLVLIIAPWNYPVALALVPLVGALAAGNCVCLKPSELTPNVSKALAAFCAELFPKDLVDVIEGGVEQSESLLKMPFDHIFFTGSTAVGKIVMRAAAEHLTPVTLELGGKSPVIIAPDADLDHAAERVVWGKSLNAGQTCVAPDFVYVQESQIQDFKAKLESARAKLQPDLSAQAQIVSVRHADRLKTMREEVKDTHRSNDNDPRRVTLTFPVDPDPKSKMMQEEIFGPIMPLIPYKDLDEVFAKLKMQDRPLALYLFSKSRKTQERILNETYSGGVCVNETLLHLGNHHLPFGGSGASGLGNYHGIASLRTFSHQRSVFQQGPLKKLSRVLSPPYTESRTGLIEKILRWF